MTIMGQNWAFCTKIYTRTLVQFLKTHFERIRHLSIYPTLMETFQLQMQCYLPTTFKTIEHFGGSNLRVSLDWIFLNWVKIHMDTLNQILTVATNAIYRMDFMK